jgi:hypothetical protein
VSSERARAETALTDARTALSSVMASAASNISNTSTPSVAFALLSDALPRLLAPLVTQLLSARASASDDADERVLDGERAWRGCVLDTLASVVMCAVWCGCSSIRQARLAVALFERLAANVSVLSCVCACVPYACRVVPDHSRRAASWSVALSSRRSPALVAA